MTNVGGVLYGTIEDGGVSNDGTVFSLTANASAAPNPSEIAMLALIALGLGGLMLRAIKSR